MGREERRAVGSVIHSSGSAPTLILPALGFAGGEGIRVFFPLPPRRSRRAGRDGVGVPPRAQVTGVA